MGPSGSGKSTLMHILAGLDRPTTGTVAIDGQEITAMGDQELTLLRRRHIGFIFQFFNLLPMLTAEENIVLPLRIAGRDAERRMGGRGDQQGRPLRPAHPPPGAALRRPAAARGDRPRAGHTADGDVRRRAHRQPRLHHQRGDPGAAARGGRELRTDHRDGHPRRPRVGDGRPHPVPGRRPDRARPGPRQRAGRADGHGGGVRRSDPGRPARPVGPQDPRRPDGDLDRPGHGHDRGHVRRPRPDHGRVRQHLPDRSREDRRAGLQAHRLHRATTAPRPGRCRRR